MGESGYHKFAVDHHGKAFSAPFISPEGLKVEMEYSDVAIYEKKGRHYTLNPVAYVESGHSSFHDVCVFAKKGLNNSLLCCVFVQATSAVYGWKYVHSGFVGISSDRPIELKHIDALKKFLATLFPREFRKLHLKNWQKIYTKQQKSLTLFPKYRVRPMKFVAWFNNNTDHSDDEWSVEFAPNEQAAAEKAYEKMDKRRFTMGRVYPIKEFRTIYGKDWPL